jgi:hypothetical protein
MAILNDSYYTTKNRIKLGNLKPGQRFVEGKTPTEIAKEVVMLLSNGTVLYKCGKGKREDVFDASALVYKVIKPKLSL